MGNTVILDKNAIVRTEIRLSHEVLEHNASLSDVVLIGIRRGGEVVARRIQQYILSQSGEEIPCSGISIAAFRDDGKQSTGDSNDFGFSIDGKTVILCDDVLNTGRSVRAAIDGLFTMGRPKGVQLLVLVDRGGREVPVRADYVGKNAAVNKSERVQVEFEELGDPEDRLYITRLE